LVNLPFASRTRFEPGTLLRPSGACEISPFKEVATGVETSKMDKDYWSARVGYAVKSGRVLSVAIGLALVAAGCGSGSDQAAPTQAVSPTPTTYTIHGTLQSGGMFLIDDCGKYPIDQGDVRKVAQYGHIEVRDQDHSLVGTGTIGKQISSTCTVEYTAANLPKRTFYVVDIVINSGLPTWLYSGDGTYESDPYVFANLEAKDWNAGNIVLNLG
jgi:hypothetical protein